MDAVETWFIKVCGAHTRCDELHGVEAYVDLELEAWREHCVHCAAQSMKHFFLTLVQQCLRDRFAWRSCVVKRNFFAFDNMDLCSV